MTFTSRSEDLKGLIQFIFKSNVTGIVDLTDLVASQE